MRALHEVLSLATIFAVVLHGVFLLGDSFLHPSVPDILIPFASGYQRLWTTLGILAGWTLAILGLSYYARARIGHERWRSLHRFAALGWLMGLVHSLGEGTDAGQTWFLVVVGLTAAPALVLLAARLGGARVSRPSTREQKAWR